MAHEWRTHPKLKRRYHPERPDDVQVIVHDGGPRMTDHNLEEVWVRITGMNDEVFTGTVLSEIDQLSSVAQGDQIRFIATGCDRLLLVTEGYLADRPDWTLIPCEQCGLDELLDPPSDLFHAKFPSAPEKVEKETFTAVCGLCGGTITVMSKDAVLEDDAPTGETRWWEFWRANAPGSDD